MYQVFYILIDGFEKIIYLLLAFSSLEFSSSEKYKKKSKNIRTKLSILFQDTNLLFNIKILTLISNRKRFFKT